MSYEEDTLNRPGAEVATASGVLSMELLSEIGVTRSVPPRRGLRDLSAASGGTEAVATATPACRSWPYRLTVAHP